MPGTQSKIKSDSVLKVRKPLTRQVAHLIKLSIVDGEYAFGERLVEAELAQKYGTSHNVVREALQMLEGEGLVIYEPFCGRSVINPTPKEIEGLYLLRIALESVAAALAAYKITPDRARELRSRCQELREEPQSFVELVELESSIHRAIWEIADEPSLTSTLEKLLWPLIRALPLLETAPESEHDAILKRQIERERTGHPCGHRPLVEAICSQDPAAARAVMIQHLVSTGSYSKETTEALKTAFGLTTLSLAPNHQGSPEQTER